MHYQSCIELRINLIVGQKILFYESSAFRSILSHIEFKELWNYLKLTDFNRGETDCFRLNEVLELCPGNFSKTFESCCFTAGTKFFLGCIAFFFTVAVNLFLLVAAAEKRSFKNVHVMLQYKFFKVSKEESQKKIADMETVVIGISCDDEL